MIETFLTIFRKHTDNPSFDSIEEHGDLWEAIRKNYLKITVTDERIRVGFMFLIPMIGMLVATQLATIGLVIGYMLV